jgi:hypothetical protein
MPKQEPLPSPLDNIISRGKIGGKPKKERQIAADDQSNKEPVNKSTQRAPEKEEPQNLKTSKSSSKKTEQEKATVQFTAYFTQQLHLKLKRFELEILERTGKKTDPNKILRQLTEKAKIEDILPFYTDE